VPRTLLHVRKDSTEALVELDGKEVIPFERGYSKIKVVGSGEVEFISVEKNGAAGKGLCNLAGDLIISPDCGYSSYSINRDYIECSKGEYKGLCDKNGNVLISTDRQYVDFFYSMFYYGFITVRSSGSFRKQSEGICDLKGNEIIPPRRGYYRCNLERDYFLVEVGEFEGVCDLTGKEIIAPTQCFTSIRRPVNNRDYYIVVSEKGYEGLLDKNGIEIISPNEEYVEINVDSNGNISKEKGRWGKFVSNRARKPSITFEQLQAYGYSTSGLKEVHVRYGDQYFSAGTRATYSDKYSHYYVDLRNGALERFEKYRADSVVYRGAIYYISR